MEKIKDRAEVHVQQVDYSEEINVGEARFGPSQLALDETIEKGVREALPSVNIEDAVTYLREFIVSHRHSCCDSPSYVRLDQHLSIAMMQEIENLLELYARTTEEKPDDVEHHLKIYYLVFDVYSPYAEVRESVNNTDDPTLPVETFRAYFIGLVLSGIFSCVNQFLSLRFPSIWVDAQCIQVVSYPIGKAFARWLPTRRFRIFRWTFSLNPGPFNQKEHMLITVMARMALSSVYASNIFEVQILKMFFDLQWARSPLYQYCIAFSMQMLGYGLAGLARTCIVFPDFCIWPQNLATIVLNRTLHEKASLSNFRIGRLAFSRFRWLIFLCGLYLVIGPGFLFSGSLEVFNWISWIKPESKTLVLIFGGNTGLGLNPIPSLSWDHISMILDPLVTPFFTTANLFFGMLLVGLLFNLPIYLTNTWYSGHLPFSTNKLYDRYGKRLDPRRLLDDRGNFDEQKYRAYSPLYATACYSVKFTFFFAAYTASVMHVLLFYPHHIWNGLKSAFSLKHRRHYQNDIHNRLMATYAEVPQWWYGTIWVASFAMAAGALAKFLPEAPVWLLVFASGISVLLIIPCGILEAVSNASITLNVISELVGGFVVPGKAIAMNMFKGYGCICLLMAIRFASDLKLGHYTKVPPRAMFRAQLLATFVCVVTVICFGESLADYNQTLVVMNWQLDNIPNICDPDQKDKFTCMWTHTFFTSSIIWGSLGPARMYGSKGIYHITLYGFLAGALLPIPIFLLSKWKYPAARHIFIPSLIYGGLMWAPFNISYLTGALYFGYLFNVYIKKRYFEWWATYNYLTASALSLATALGSIFLYFAFQAHGIGPDWWGTNASFQGLDQSAGFPWFPIPEEGFGPAPGEFE